MTLNFTITPYLGKKRKRNNHKLIIMANLHSYIIKYNLFWDISLGARGMGEFRWLIFSELKSDLGMCHVLKKPSSTAWHIFIIIKLVFKGYYVNINDVYIQCGTKGILKEYNII